MLRKGLITFLVGSYRKKFLNPTKLSLEEFMTLSNPELQRATLVQQYLLATAELSRFNEFELTDLKFMCGTLVTSL